MDGPPAAAPVVPPVTTLNVPHLGGIQVGYRASPRVLDPRRPTLVMYNPFSTSSDYYIPEFQDPEQLLLASRLNLVAVEPLGHGQTHARRAESWNFWDTAIMTFQLLDILGIDKVFALGTSQGGWIAARLAIMDPERVQGIIPIGSSMDSESIRSRELGCWDGPLSMSGMVKLAADINTSHPDFEPGQGYYDFLMDIGYGGGNKITREVRDFWADSIGRSYQGNSGKKRLSMSAVAVVGRDGLHERLPFVRCPVLWFHGTDDVVFSIDQAREDIKLFINSPSAKVISCDGGPHFLGMTHGALIRREVLGFIQAFS